MNRYELLNAAEKVAGYYNPEPHEVALGKQKEAFERAKAECLRNLRAQVAQIEELSFEQFKAPEKAA